MAKSKENLEKGVTSDDKNIEKNIETTSKDGTKRGTNPNSRKNLKPAKQGEVRNPTGRGKGALDYKTRVTMAIDVLAQKYVADYNSKHKKQIKIEDVDIFGDIFQQAINKARNGDMKAIIDFFDRLYGKAKTHVEVSGVDGGPIQHATKTAEADAETDDWFKMWTKPSPQQIKKDDNQSDTGTEAEG